MARRLLFWTSWYVPLVVLWLAFVDTLAAEEVAAGLVAAAIAATAAEVVRAQDLVRFHLRPRWLRDLPQLPWQVVRDTWLLAVALWRHLGGRPVQGTFRVVAFPSEADHARSAARRAVVTALVSVAPNTVVVGIEGDEGVLLVHQLVPEAGSPVPPSLLEEGERP